MSSRKNPWKEIGRPDYEGVHLMPFDLENRAVQHELNRQRVISQIFLDLYCMAALGLFKKGMPVALRGASSQNLSGSKSDQTEAAHCAPRQILIGTQRPQDILFLSFPERAFVIDSLFAETDILPANFNKSDSRAERNGLKEAFRSACETVITAGHIHGNLDKFLVSTALKNAYEIYKVKAKKAFQYSARRLKDKLDKIQASRVQHTIRSKEKRKWEEQFAITGLYADTLHESAGVSVVLEPGRIEGIFKIYEMIERN